MDFIITFFRDILDGPVYIVVTVICSILICACIGYLAEKRQKKRLEKEQYVEVSNTSIPVATVSSVVPKAPVVPAVASTVVATPAISTVPTASSVSSPNIQQVGGDFGVNGSVPDNSVSSVIPVQIDKPAVTPIPTTTTGLPSSSAVSTAPSIQPTGGDVSTTFQTVLTPQGSNLGQSPEVPTSVNQG